MRFVKPPALPALGRYRPRRLCFPSFWAVLDDDDSDDAGKAKGRSTEAGGGTDETRGREEDRDDDEADDDADDKRGTRPREIPAGDDRAATRKQDTGRGGAGRGASGSGSGSGSSRGNRVEKEPKPEQDRDARSDTAATTGKKTRKGGGGGGKGSSEGDADGRGAEGIVAWVAADPKHSGFVIAKTVVDRAQVKSVLQRYGIRSQPLPTKKVTHIIVPNKAGPEAVGDNARSQMLPKTPVVTLEKLIETCARRRVDDDTGLRAFLAEENDARARKLEEKEAAKADKKRNKKKGAEKGEGEGARTAAEAKAASRPQKSGGAGGGGGANDDDGGRGAGSSAQGERTDTQVLHTHSPYLYIGDAEYTAHAKSQLSSSFDDWAEFCRHVSPSNPSHTFTGDDPDKKVAYISNAGSKNNSYTVVRRSDAQGHLLELSVKLNNRPAPTPSTPRSKHKDERR